MILEEENNEIVTERTNLKEQQYVDLEEQQAIIEPQSDTLPHTDHCLKCPWECKSYGRLVFLIVLAAVIALGVIFREELKWFIFTENGAFRSFVNGLGWGGPFVFIGIYILWTLLTFPGPPLTLAAGLIFPEFYIAFLSAYLGATLGVTISFLLGRTILRSWIERSLPNYPIFNPIHKAITHKGILMALLLRLSPIAPSHILSYGLAVSSISGVGFVVGSWVGMVPEVFVYVYVSWVTGYALSYGSSSVVFSVLVYGVGSLVTVSLLVVVVVLSKKQIMLLLDDNSPF